VETIQGLLNVLFRPELLLAIAALALWAFCKYRKFCTQNKIMSAFILGFPIAFFALSALEGVNLAMYSAVKRCVPLVTLGLSVVVLGKPPPTKPMLASVLLISMGAAVAGELNSLLVGGA
jgi:drug/metabolite transporter (DMT)-like permease